MGVARIRVRRVVIWPVLCVRRWRRRARAGVKLDRMRAAHLVTSILIALCFSLACASVRTQYDYDPAVDFSGWRTYAWYPDESPRTGQPRLDNPLLHDRIEAAVSRGLAAKGFSPAGDGEPDFYVQFHLSTQQKLDVNTMNTGYRGGPYGRRWGGVGWGGVGWTETTVIQYDEGTLVIDFVDRPARRLAWRGSGTRRLARNPDPELVTKRVNEAVNEILAQFPPHKE